MTDQTHLLRAASIAALVLLFLACALAGGPGNSMDSWFAAHAARWRAPPAVLDAALVVTWLGSAPVTLFATAASSLFLAWRRQGERAAILFAGVVLARLSIDGLKLYFARARPPYDIHMFHPYGLSFPSGHAGNSMATYGLIALLAAPARHRTPAIASALIVALFVGSTRIVLGVHWMTDVIGGWSAGLVALVLVASLSRARTAA